MILKKTITFILNGDFRCLAYKLLNILLTWFKILERLSITSDGDRSGEDYNELSAVSNLKPKVLLALDKLREKKKRPDISSITYVLQKTEARNSYLIESAINKWIGQKIIVNKKSQKGNDSVFWSTKSEAPWKSKTENRQQCVQQELIGK